MENQALIRNTEDASRSRKKEEEKKKENALKTNAAFIEMEIGDKTTNCRT